MSDFRKIAAEALKRANKTKKGLNEGVVYPDNASERMHPKLEEDLVNRTHSLGKHPVFPEGDESSFEEKIMGERFSEVTKRYKRAFDVDQINNQQVISDCLELLYETMGLEAKHKKALQKLAVEMIREEFQMDDDVVEIKAELVNDVTLIGTKKNPKPVEVQLEFKNHDEMVNATEEVYKRRFMNAMIQGAAKKCHHMFHMVEEELTDLDPRLPNKYAKLMAGADYAMYILPAVFEQGVGNNVDAKDKTNVINGGIVRVQFANKSNPKPVIHAQALTFPVLIHELTKGIMELMSGHGLPKKKKLGEYVINKADFLAAEPWDMRIGPAIWSRFTNAIEPDDFHLKHHIYSELAALPVREFNMKMREIMAGTKEGKKIIKKIVDEVNTGLKEDEFNEAIGAVSNVEPTNEISDSEKEVGFNFEDLFKDENSDESEGFGFEELL